MRVVFSFALSSGKILNPEKDPPRLLQSADYKESLRVFASQAKDIRGTDIALIVLCWVAIRGAT